MVNFESYRNPETSSEKDDRTCGQEPFRIRLANIINTRAPDDIYTRRRPCEAPKSLSSQLRVSPQAQVLALLILRFRSSTKMDTLSDISLRRHRLGSTIRLSATASSSDYLLIIRVMQHSGSTFKKLVVRRQNMSSVRPHEMFDYLASRPPIQHPHIALEEIINGTDGPPARPGFQDAIGFIVRTSCLAGNILEFLRACPKRDSEKLRLVTQVASALQYLHSLDVVHGNVCPTNILITDNNQAVLTDIGIYSAIVDFIFEPSGRVPIPPTAPYKPPEELEESADVVVRTTDKDVYSLACSTYEIMSGRRPFAKMPLYTCVVAITRRGHLSLARPTGVSVRLWQLLRACWAFDPAGRPAMQEVREQLETLLAGDV